MPIRAASSPGGTIIKNTEHLVMTNNVDEVVPPVTAWLKEVTQ